MYIIFKGSSEDRDCIDDGREFSSFEFRTLLDALTVTSPRYGIGLAQVSYTHKLTAECLSDNAVVTEFNATDYLFLANVPDAELFYEYDLDKFLALSGYEQRGETIKTGATLGLREMGPEFVNIYAVVNRGIKPEEFIAYRTPKGKVIKF